MTFTFMLIILLVSGVIFVNGWTDAPNAIATVVSTRVMSAKKAVYMSAVFNFLGVVVMSLINGKVAYTISNMVSFGSGQDSLVALCAAMIAIVIFAVVAWYFGIPTSESHALIAGLTGAAISISGFSAVNTQEWIKVLYGILVSSVLGFGSGFVLSKLISALFKNVARTKANKFFSSGQIFGAASMSFLHGAQDGQKFIGVFMLATFLSKNMDVPESFDIPMYAMIFTSLLMGVGTSIGGYKIIKTVGMDMVKLEKYQGFASDLAASLCLLLSSVLGLPVSTTHTKTTAIMGVAAAKRRSSVNWRVVGDMVMAWIITFPVCGAIGFLVSKVFMLLF